MSQTQTDVCETVINSLNTTIAAFADDNTSLTAGKYSYSDRTHDVLNSPVSHFTRKNLAFNQNKTGEILFSFGHSEVLDVPNISKKDNVKLLGVFFDEKLTFATTETLLPEELPPRFTSFEAKTSGLQSIGTAIVIQFAGSSCLTCCCSVCGG